MNSYRHYAGLLIGILAGLLPVSVYALETEYITDGRFELGTINVDIQRYPRYPKLNPESVPRIIASDQKGGRCLLLPAMPEGGYRLTYAPFKLIPRGRYHFQAVLQSNDKTDIRVEVRSGSRRLERKIWSVKNNKIDMDFDFIAANETKNKTSVHALRIWIQPQGDACLRLVSLRGPAEKAQPQPLVNITPDQPLGVYGMGETAYMNVTAAPSLTQISYRIIDPVTQTLIDNKTLTPKKGEELKITLPTDRRGFFRVDLVGDHTDEVLAERAYVVINREKTPPGTSRRYGLAMEEEHGLHAMISAGLAPKDIYRLATDIGAGSIRIFTPAKPGNLSRDGIRYNFHQLDAALDLADKYNLEVMLELGSNAMHRIPAWLRSMKAGRETINLENGLHTKRLKKAFARTTDKGSYLSLTKYRLYLQRVFEHLAGRVNFFEIWNEPGHKLKPKDYVRISDATRSVQKEFASQAKLLGPTSTAVREHGHGRNPDTLPNFALSVMKLGLGKDIDIFSYHSRHAFPFMGKNFDRRNQETGYAQRLRQILNKTGAEQLPIWDTERGVPWKSYHSQRTDIWHGKKGPNAWVGSYDYLEPARRLPEIFSASWAEGVERLFWFNVDPGTSTIAHSQARWGFFDADMEPMPHIAAYDAYSEIVGDGIFHHRMDKADGTRAYIFSRDRNTVVVAFNWMENTSTIQIHSPGSQITIMDVMGNKVATGKGEYQLTAGSWPQYVIIDKPPESIKIK